MLIIKSFEGGRNAGRRRGTKFDKTAKKETGSARLYLEKCDNGRNDIARYYEETTELCRLLGQQIPQDFSASELFNDKEKLKPYCSTILRICDLEEKAV